MFDENVRVLKLYKPLYFHWRFLIVVMVHLQINPRTWSKSDIFYHPIMQKNKIKNNLCALIECKQETLRDCLNDQ